MKKILSIVVALVLTGTILPPVVKALTNASISVRDVDTGQYINDRFTEFALAEKDLATGEQLPNGSSEYGFGRGYWSISRDFVPGDIALISYTIFASGYEFQYGDLLIKSNEHVEFKLKPVAGCGDFVCTPNTQETSVNCPGDCSVCGDNACNHLPENRVNCPADCDVPRFLRGDVDANGKIDVMDTQRIYSWLYSGQNLDCQDAADVNDDGKVDLSDSVYLSEFISRKRRSLPVPFLSKGYDPTPDSIKCAQYGL